MSAAPAPVQVIPGAFYVTWPSKECADGMPNAAVEGVAWTEVPLSERCGWQEQHEKAAAA